MIVDDENVEFAAIPGLHQPPDHHAAAIETPEHVVDDVDVDVVNDDSYVDQRPPDEDEPEIEEQHENRVAVGGAGPALGARTLEAGVGGVVVFATLEEWVEKWLLPVYRRSVDGHAMTWCREWWRHPEAYLRLDALWRAWEYLRKQPATGMAVWLRDYCDPHMAVLLSESGPFKGCEPTRHSTYELAPLPTFAPPSWETLAQTYEGLRSRHWDDEDR
ncbi:MAG: DUF4913 domain-containing protein [Solirubrobacteraceae bacterium]